MKTLVFPVKSIAMRTAEYEKSNKERGTQYSWDPRNERHSSKDQEVDVQVNVVEQAIV